MKLGLGLGITRHPAASVSAGISFGNDTYPTRGTASNAPNARRLGMIGDSRVEGDQPGQFAFEVLCACGEWIWGDFRNYNYGVGGSTINDAVTSQAPAAVADGCLTYIVLTGTNGAGSGTDTLADRQSETLALLAALDQVGATIFLCNEMPGQSDGGTGTGSPLVKVQHHEWIDTLTAASASLSNADLVIVDTWGAVTDGGSGTAANLAEQWRNDGLHPAFQGQERMCLAVWTAMNAHFGTDVHLDFSTPAQNLCDGTTTATVNRGTLPSGWNDFTAADDLVYATTGTGLDTVLTAANSGASTLAMNTRKTPAAVTDGVLFIEYSIEPNPSADPSQGASRDFAQRWSLRNVDFGTGTPVSITNTASNSSIVSSQDYETGGRRRACLYVGATSTSPRVDTLVEVAGGQTVTIHRVEIHER